MNTPNVHRIAVSALALLIPACKPAAPPAAPPANAPAKSGATETNPPTKTEDPSTKPFATPDTATSPPPAKSEPPTAPSTAKKEAPAESPSARSVAPTDNSTAKPGAPIDKPAAKTAAPVDNQPLLDMLCELPMWRHSRDFTAQEWDQFIAAARRIQTSNPDEVRAALVNSAHCGPTMDLDAPVLEFLITSKEFILLRIVFDVPESVPPEYPNKFWKRSADAPWTVSWPVRWRNGRPEQLARFAGFEGFAYIPAGEWDYFKAEFPFRKLPAP